MLCNIVNATFTMLSSSKEKKGLPQRPKKEYPSSM